MHQHLQIHPKSVWPTPHGFTTVQHILSNHVVPIFFKADYAVTAERLGGHRGEQINRIYFIILRGSLHDGVLHRAFVGESYGGEFCIQNRGRSSAKTGELVHWRAGKEGCWLGVLTKQAYTKATSTLAEKVHRALVAKPWQRSCDQIMLLVELVHEASPVFRESLYSYQQQLVCRFARIEYCDEGQRVQQQRNGCQCMYVILAGELTVVSRSDSGGEEKHQLGAGAAWGEDILSSESSREAKSAIATAATVLMCLSAAACTMARWARDDALPMLLPLWQNMEHDGQATLCDAAFFQSLYSRVLRAVIPPSDLMALGELELVTADASRSEWAELLACLAGEDPGGQAPFLDIFQLLHSMLRMAATWTSNGYAHTKLLRSSCCPILQCTTRFNLDLFRVSSNHVCTCAERTLMHSRVS